MATQERPVVLVVDDTPENIRILMELLREEYAILAARDGEKALRLALGKQQPDIILLDVVMPGLDGYEVCRALKANEKTRDIPIIFVTSKNETEEEALGLALGAVDYITKPFNPAILKARVANHLALRLAYREVEESRKMLAADLALASDYVVSQLPPKLAAGPVLADWLFLPSSSLGGDALGYHSLDDDHLAFYLLDVCSHGVGPALLSVQALNVLRYETMPGVDFRDPGQVLSGLNAIFQMSRHNNLYFTIVYGVYHPATHTLAVSTAGHPPPLLFAPGGGMETLKLPNLMIGALPVVRYKTRELALEPGSTLYLFSDGAYEVEKAGGDYMTYNEFAGFLHALHGTGNSALADVLDFARSQSASNSLMDDFSLLRLAFP